MPDLIECRKCGAKWDPDMMQRKNTVACALCKEPMPEMMELDKATWEEGDFTGMNPLIAHKGKGE